MNLTLKSTIFRSTLAITLLCLVTGVGCFGLLGFRQQQLAQKQLEELGETLANQLAISVEQPLFQKDLVSLQVQLTSVAQNSNIRQVSIYSADNRLLAQSLNQRSRANAGQKGRFANFTRPISIDNAIAGYVTVSIDRRLWHSLYRRPVSNVLWLFSAMTLLLILAVWLLSLRLSRRLRRLAGLLPDPEPLDDDNQKPADELDALEFRLTPLLTAAPEPPVSPSKNKYHAIVFCRLCNISRLREQLSQNNYESLINLVDTSVANICRLYSGQRLMGNANIIRLGFSSLDENGDYPLRALSSTRLLFDLLTEQSRKQGMELELSAALALHAENLLQTTSLRDQSFQGVFDLLGKYIDISSRNEILESEQFSRHPSIVEESRFVPLGEDSASCRFEAFKDNRRQLLAKQLDYLIQIA